MTMAIKSEIAAEIKYRKGDATAPVGPKGAKIIVHVCNDIGGWGGGFVAAISRRWDGPEREYRQQAKEGKGFELGSVQFVQVEADLFVANLIGQHKVHYKKGEPPIRYDAIRTGLVQIAQKAVELEASVHMPRIGCGLAGGTWHKIEPILIEKLSESGIPVTVYDFEEPQKAKKEGGLTAKQWLAIVLIGLVAVVLHVWKTTPSQYDGFISSQKDTLSSDQLEAYKTLGLKPFAKLKTIKKAYRSLSLQYHPDKTNPAALSLQYHPDKTNPAAQGKLMKTAKAYAILSDLYADGERSMKFESFSAPQRADPSEAALLLEEATTADGSDEGYDEFDTYQANQVTLTSEEPVSTFSVDVDTASYAYARRKLKDWQLPSPAAINIEEFINYFDYDFPQPKNETIPFEPSVVVSDSPWNKGRKLMQIAIKGYDVDPSARPFSNIVFLVDVSGSMASPDKLPLARESIKMLLNKLQPEDFVSIVTYASNVNVPLHPTPAAHKDKILSVLDSLRAGGATWGTGGIEKAYELAEKNFDKDAVNRIMLLTDGDFNIGLADSGSLQTYIEGKRETGIFLSVLGFGMSDYKDTTMKALANHGNGVAAYIDSLEEAQKVMATESSSTVFPIAKDVKVQIEFNPAMVHEYRLVGYEKRLLQREDFNNDNVDAGDIGAGHTVTAIYELTPVGSEEARAVDPLRYGGDATTRAMTEMTDEYAFIKLRYKLPNENESKLISRPVTKEDCAEIIMQQNSIERRMLVDEFCFGVAVASFAKILKGEHDATTFARVIELAEASLGEDPHGYRKEFVSLVRTADIMGLPGK